MMGKQTTTVKTGSSRHKVNPMSEDPISEGNDEQLEWRDTYFVLFKQTDRPTLTQVEAAITESSKRLKLENLEADEDGMFESLLVQAPQDNAALEISYERGEAVAEQSVELVKQMKEDLEPKQIQRMLKADARLDIMLFERVRDDFADDDDEEWEGGSLDPSSLLNVVVRAGQINARPADRPGLGGGTNLNIADCGFRIADYQPIVFVPQSEIHNSKLINYVGKRNQTGRCR